MMKTRPRDSHDYILFISEHGDAHAGSPLHLGAQEMVKGILFERGSNE
jgi:hypothetical protein